MLFFFFLSRLPYKMYFGGVSALTPTHYLKMNGFPNNYWGWGGEDDDIGARWEYLGRSGKWLPVHSLMWKIFYLIFNATLRFWVHFSAQLQILSYNWSTNIPHIFTSSVKNMIKRHLCHYLSVPRLYMMRSKLTFASYLCRVSLAGMYITRPSLKTGRYKMIKHKLDKGNDVNPKRYNWNGPEFECRLECVIFQSYCCGRR